MLEDLLGANAFLIGSRGTVLAIDRASGKALIQRFEPIAGLADSGLAGPLYDFVDAAMQWSGRLVPAEGAAEADPGPAGVDLA